MFAGDRKPLAIEALAAPRAPLLLLHLFATALLACIVVGTALYLHWSFGSVVSLYRRQMNAAAYDAQLYFDQRELLLRSISASSVRNTNLAPVSATPAFFGDTRQISVLPLREDADAYDWALILTPRDKNDIRLAGAQLVYTSVRQATTRRIAIDGAPHAAPIAAPIAAQTRDWITRSLAGMARRAGPGGRAPIVWLRPPMDEVHRLFLYTPMDVDDPGSGWLGLEVDGIASLIRAQWTGSGSYALFDTESHAALHDAPVPLSCERMLTRVKEDSFGLQGENWYSPILVLSKSVGEAGWRLVYYTPVRRVLQDGAFALQSAVVAALLLCASVILGVRHIKKRLVAPAVRQYEALADSVSLNRKLFEVAPVGLCLVRRADGALVLSNEKARRWFDGHAGWQQEILSVQGAEGGHEYVLEDGRHAFLTFTATQYQGEAVVLCGISDISAQKQVESSLRQAKRASDAASQAKTQFLATISHEIRTPLYGILGTLELLSLTGLSGQQARYLETIQQSSSTLLRTINDTLDLSRIESGRTVLEMGDFSPMALLDNVVAGFAARAHGKGLRIYAVTEVDVPMAVTGDANRILQILNNLVSNAVKFTDSGHVVLRASVRSVTAGVACLQFQVADTGSGIAAEHHASLFEPYYRANASLDPCVAGTGLGLSICWRLSELMDGRLAVVSEPGLGTSITFSVALRTAAPGDAGETIALAPRAVYVHGAVPEVVANLCGWLRRWGAVALPYRDHPGRKPARAVLVEAWPRPAPALRWKGPRVTVQPPAGRTGTDGGAGAWLADSPSPASIGRAVRLAQDGVGPPAPFATHAAVPSLGLRVLVAEDNPISQIILREQLEHLGCTVALASNGEEALGRKDILDFDAILTDLNMPLLDGYGLARSLRQRGYAQPILGITSNVFPDAIRRGVRSGMTDVLHKPLPLTALTQTLLGIQGARN